jgi:hypothetical protein
MQISVADRPGLLGATAHLLQGQRVGVGISTPLGEGTEPAPGVADVREVDVAVDDVGHLVAHGVAAQVVGDPRERIKRGAFGIEQRESVGVAKPGRVALGSTQGRPLI